MKRYLKTYDHVKYFFDLNETAFYAKLLKWFSGRQTKVTQSIASKFGTNIQLINLKLL